MLLLVLSYTSGWREELWKWKVLSKNTTEWLNKMLGPRSLNVFYHSSITHCPEFLEPCYCRKLVVNPWLEYIIWCTVLIYLKEQDGVKVVTLQLPPLLHGLRRKWKSESDFSVPKVEIGASLQSLTKLADTESVWALLKEVLQNEV